MSAIDDLLRPAHPEGDSLWMIAWAGIKLVCIGTAIIWAVPLLLLFLILLIF